MHKLDAFLALLLQAYVILADLGYPVKALWCSCSQRLYNYLSFQSFGIERTWWNLFQKRV
jgi:hypothetical protein